MLRTSAALAGFQKTARAFGVDAIKAVATSAAREAVNREDFVRRVYEDSGLRLKVISGLEEARLIYLGVSRGLNLGREKALIVDIGGGSLELIVGDRQGCDQLDSLPLGAARLTELFNFNAGDGLVSPEKYAELVGHVARHSRRFSEEARNFDLKSAYGSSGTIRNLAQINYHRRLDQGAGPAPPAFLAADSLRSLGLWLGGLDFKTRRKVRGLDGQKVKIIVAGCAGLEAVLRALKIEGLTAVNYGLKHGLLYEFADGRRSDGI
jgi:exopolyphosphatase/guanosine-5'-triphosphate,3'-diphosphate pyrophosphatase